MGEALRVKGSGIRDDANAGVVVVPGFSRTTTDVARPTPVPTGPAARSPDGAEQVQALPKLDHRGALIPGAAVGALRG